MSLDADRRVRFVNVAAARILGREADDLLGRSIWAELPTGVASMFDRHCNAALGDRAATVDVEEHVEALGRWLSVQAHPTHDGVAVVFQDVTRLKTLTTQREDLLGQLLGTQAVERARIAADVHDDSLQSLGLMTLQLQLLRRHLPTCSPENQSLLDGLGTQVTRTADRLRALLFSLEPTDDDVPIAQSIRNQAAHIFHGTSIRWSVDDAGAGVELNAAERGQVARVTKEALTNARAHAQASNVTVTLTGDCDGLEVVVADDGLTMDPATLVSAPGHRGLASMRDRASAVGGWCTIEASVPRGCTVRCFVPRSGASTRPGSGSAA